MTDPPRLLPPAGPENPPTMRNRGIAGAFAWILLVAGPSWASETAGDPAFQADVASFVSTYCAKCHGPEKPKGGLNLVEFADAESALKARKTWSRVRDALEAGTMPPDDAPQPASGQSEKVVRWVQSAFSRADCRINDDPGRVTLRRLNRAEYRNTVRDLLLVDYAPTEDFPSDDVGYGFDNIGDVLTLPPILMERYLAAAEAIAARAVVDDNPPKPRVLNLFIPIEKSSALDRVKRNGLRLNSVGSVGLAAELPSDGDYFLRVQATAEQAGPELAKMAMLVDGKEVHRVDVKTRSEFGTFQAKFHAEKGMHKFEVAFLNDFYDESKPEGQRDRNLIVRNNFWEVVGPLPVDNGRLPESHKRVVFKKPRDLNDSATIRALLERLAIRAFRRPVTSEELTRLLQVVELAKLDGERVEVGLRLAVQAILVSPHFLFHVELDRGANGASHLVDEYELASRLSYFLWSSMPDDELLEAARKNQLRSPGVLETQVKRLLQDPKSRAMTENFAAQWLQIRKLRDSSPDKAAFPKFDEALRTSMKKETELYFSAVVREDRSILDFLDSDFSFLNDRLARHYGMDAVAGNPSEFKRVTFTDGRRGGLLTQASILTVTSNPTRTSPVKRGKWVLEQLLGEPPPPPPPNVPDLKDEKGHQLSGTLRQKMEQHRANPACATCHAKMDPLGFGLENFDATGAWREKEGGFPIDPSGTLPGGQSFRGPKGLREVLKGKGPPFTRCLSEKLLTYALGRGLEETDRCVVEKIAKSVESDGHRFSRMVLEIVRSDPFQKRKTKGETTSP